MSQLLSRLEEQLRTVRDPAYHAELSVRRACYLVRIGRFDEAERVLAEVRRTHGDGRWPRISCWLMLTEGVLAHYKEVSPRARDRISRAQLISVAMKLPQLAALTSAWKAHLEYEHSDFGAMSAALRLSLLHAEDDDHDSRARSAMVLSNCFFLIGDRQSAQKWFLESRHHALEAGDQATIDALLYNRAATGMAWLRAEGCFMPQDPNLISLVKLEIASARNFQDMIRIAALTHYIHLCEARILIIAGDYEAALGALRRVREEGPFAEYNFNKGLIDFDAMFCLARLGQIQGALDLYPSLQKSQAHGMDVDDRLVEAWMRHELALIHPDFGVAAQRAVELEELRREYLTSRETIRRCVHDALSLHL